MERQDWLALLEDLASKKMNFLGIGLYRCITCGGDQKKIAPIARKRQNARIALMAHCERAKEKFAAEALAMRNHPIFMQMFYDIATYIENAEEPKLDLMDVSGIMSQKSSDLR